MILTCPACQTRYEADAAKFPPQGRNVRCARCGEVWHQAAAEPEYPPAPEAEPELEAVPPPPPEEPQEEPRPDYYAQPEVREAAPQPEEEAPQAVPQPSLWPRRLALGTGWVALAAVVVAAVLVMALWRRQIVQVWPQSASLYAALGVKVNTTGLDIVDVKSSQAPQNGQIVLTVSGALTNVTGKELPVPQIRVGLTDNDRRELYHWTFAADVMTLRPGQTTHFVTRLSSPPDGARHLEVRFAKAGE